MNDALALETARKIEAIFAREHKGGEVQRRAAIQCAVLDAIAAAVPLVGVERAAPPLRAREEIVGILKEKIRLVARPDYEETEAWMVKPGCLEQCADAVLALSSTAGQEWREPEGWQLVPKELTEDMAAEIECSDGTDEGWQRALAACPPLPAPPAEPIVAEQETK